MRTKPKIQIDLAEVERLAGLTDNEEEIATALGISYTTLKKRKRESALFASAIKKGKQKANRDVIGALYKNCMEGNVTAQIFWAKTRCGFIETTKQEITGRNGAPLKIETQDNIDTMTPEELIEFIKLEEARESRERLELEEQIDGEGEPETAINQTTKSIH